jgi:S1-C subfamily serine protease
VVDNSPAFVGDVLPGDILLSIDEFQITGVQGFQLALDRAVGRNVPVVIRRGANTITKIIPMLNI